MSSLLEIAVCNLIVAALLALPAALAGLWGKRPALTHALWLLVFLKLITPPLFRYPIDWPTPPATVQEPVAEAGRGSAKDAQGVPEPRLDQVVRAEPSDQQPPPKMPPANAEVEHGPTTTPNLAQAAQSVAVSPAVPEALPTPAKGVESDREPAPLPPQQPVAETIEANVWPSLILGVWLAGSSAWLLLALWRSWRFHRLLRFAEPAPVGVQNLALDLAASLRVRCPEVCLLPGNISPMLWVWGRTPRLLLPAGLLERLPPEQLATLLAHELAHWRRRDHRVRWLEMIVLMLYWWCPLVWWARRELQQAEEECCDAWVVSLLPGEEKTYALALLETVDFLSGAPAGLPLVASGVGHVRFLKRRLTMILQGKTPRALTSVGLLSVTGLGLLLLPMVPTWGQAPATKQEKPADLTRQEQLDRAQKEVQRIKSEIDREAILRQAMDLLEQLRKMDGDLKRNNEGGQVLPTVPNPDGKSKKRQGGGAVPVAPGDVKNKAGTGGGLFNQPLGNAGKPLQIGGPGMQPLVPSDPNLAPGANPVPPGQAWVLPGQAVPANPYQMIPGGPGGMIAPPGGGQSGHTEKRLQEVERKLDLLLKEMRDLRNDMKQGPKNKMTTPNADPKTRSGLPPLDPGLLRDAPQSGTTPANQVTDPTRQPQPLPTPIRPRSDSSPKPELPPLAR
jgi:bla regulator protein blaR1